MSSKIAGRAGIQFPDHAVGHCHHQLEQVIFSTRRLVVYRNHGGVKSKGTRLLIENEK